ncbi:MAG: FAD-dependent oxidoreductase, partial [Myxococcota bacterium]
RQRIGGRVYTERVGDVAVDLGASWIHGVDGNPIAELCHKRGIPTAINPDDRGLIVLADGSQIRHRSLWSEVYQVVDRAGRWARRQDRDMPLSQAVAHIRKRRVSAAQRSPGPSLSSPSSPSTGPSPSPLIDPFIDLGLDWLTLVTGVEIDQLSACYWEQDEELGGAEALFADGYDRVAKAVAEGLDIELGWTAQAVTRDDDGVTVRVAATAAERESSTRELRGRAAVVTVPLGVLKAGAITFAPELPAAKRAAIARLGFGVLDKVALVFEPGPADRAGSAPAQSAGDGPCVARWWPPDFHNLVVAPSRDHDIIGYTSMNTAGQPVLLGWFAGRTAHALEERTDSELAEIALSNLARVTGADPRPWLRQVLVSRWARDPLSRGSYSYVPLGATGAEYDELATPVDGQLYFAGEACHRTYPATVHGAYLSGLRAAEHILADEPGRTE